MAIKYVRYGTVKVSKKWAIVLRAADKARVKFHVNSGHRTMRQQWRLWRENMMRVGLRWVPKPNHPLTAFPSPFAPHIWRLRPAHALDVSSVDGGETRLQRWLEKHGATVYNPVDGEAWHLVISDGDLRRLARKFSKR